ncbi:hypothetical protein [uncultured Nocardioides sp.]|uniref:hypothetical protein n=1 Tax=uncultured Nocardioides sp. TaxID=198441 RepID=UPI0025FF26B1|nr:hypothetical protein [uncultured Nocardioides sp.]
MAKALIGHLNSDPRTTARLSAQNHRLRARVADLERLVVRLQQENDRLTAAQAAVLLERETQALEQMMHA